MRILLLSLLLSACGQAGDLYLPDQKAERAGAPAQESNNPTPATQEGATETVKEPEPKKE